MVKARKQIIEEVKQAIREKKQKRRMLDNQIQHLRNKLVVLNRGG